ncbi:MAG: DUF4199 domain-containing protein [Prevotella sp.]|nr:DUF4199 domain-containing protein [Prevotella sp.]
MAITSNDSRDNSSAGKDGLRFSVILIAAFLCMMGSFRQPLLNMLSMGLLIYAPFFVGRCVGKYRDRNLNGNISFGKAFFYAFQVFVCGIIILTFAQYIYFQYFDKGAFVNQYVEIFSNPEYKEMLQSLGFTADVRKDFINMLTALRPIDLAIQFMSTNLFVGTFLSILVGAFIRKRKNIS